MIKVAATADVHSPRNLELLKASLHRLREADLLILAGDLVFRGRVEAIDKLLSAIQAYYTGPAVACFGNEEFDEVKEALKERTRGFLRWLDDEPLTLVIKGLKVGLVGTRGCLDQPTSWQLRNVPGVRELYLKRAELIDRLLVELSCDYKILFSHYALAKDTLKGERPSVWSQLGSLRMEEVVRRRKPTVAIHGHAHNATVLSTWVDGTLVLNVSLPASRELVFFNLPLERPAKPSSPTLASFL
ncbi:MAG: metallophosphoesterase family protein [Candidatus Nezhaarchaeota archaeon]|nr:metallophosphoesterase family protein [Candidatus Nezhaarchaeota archaeon]